MFLTTVTIAAFAANLVFARTFAPFSNETCITRANALAAGYASGASGVCATGLAKGVMLAVEQAHCDNRADRQVSHVKATKYVTCSRSEDTSALPEACNYYMTTNNIQSNLQEFCFILRYLFGACENLQFTNGGSSEDTVSTFCSQASMAALSTVSALHPTTRNATAAVVNTCANTLNSGGKGTAVYIAWQRVCTGDYMPATPGRPSNTFVRNGQLIYDNYGCQNVPEGSMSCSG